MLSLCKSKNIFLFACNLTFSAMIGYINNNVFFHFSKLTIRMTTAYWWTSLSKAWFVTQVITCCVGSYRRFHTRVFGTRIISKPLNKICIPCGVWSIVQHVKIWSDYIRWLDYYHGSKILVWNLLVWSYSSPWWGL